MGVLPPCFRELENLNGKVSSYSQLSDVATAIDVLPEDGHLWHIKHHAELLAKIHRKEQTS